MAGSVIRELSIENFGVIREARLNLADGMNVITGESGAGKSLMVSALDTAFGARALAEQVGRWGERARVRLAVELPADDPVWDKLAPLGIDPDDMLVIQREWGRDLRSIMRLSGQIVPLSAARAALAGLVELSGQHEHQRLSEPRFARVWLDQWVPADLLAEVRDAWAEHAAHAEERDRLAAQAGASTVVAAWRDEVAALEALHVNPEEDAELAERVARARAADQLAAWYQMGLDRLDGAGAALVDAGRALGDAGGMDASVKSAAALVADAAALVDEARHEVHRRWAALDQDAGDVSRWSDRLDRLARARRRYNTDLAGLVAILAERREALQAVDEAEFRLSRIKARIDRALRRHAEASQQLGAARREAAVRAGREVQAILPDLDLPSAVFRIEVSEGDPGPHGTDDVSWVFAANPGQAPRPLHRVASGGERARVLLALNIVRESTGALVFDEVDAGLGGHAAERVAGVLAALARRQQLVVVSHQAVVAARAARHWHVVKGEDGESQLVCMEGAERVREIARMLSGTLTEVAERHAADLLRATGGDATV